MAEASAPEFRLARVGGLQVIVTPMAAVGTLLLGAVFFSIGRFAFNQGNVAAIVGGVGGGLLIADMVSPKSPKPGAEQTRLERRMSPAPLPAANAPAEPVQYLAASQLPAAVAAPPAQAQDQTQPANSGSAGAQATSS